MTEISAIKFIDTLHPELKTKGKSLDRNFMFQLILSSISLYYIFKPETVKDWVKGISVLGVKIEPTLFFGLIPILIFVLIYQLGYGIGRYLRKCEIFHYWLVAYKTELNGDEKRHTEKVIFRTFSPDNFVYQIYQHLKIHAKTPSHFLPETYSNDDFISDLEIKNKLVPFIITYLVSTMQGVSQGVLLYLIYTSVLPESLKWTLALALILILWISYRNLIIDRAVSLGARSAFAWIVFIMTTESIALFLFLFCSAA